MEAYRNGHVTSAFYSHADGFMELKSDSEKLKEYGMVEKYVSLSGITRDVYFDQKRNIKGVPLLKVFTYRTDVKKLETHVVGKVQLGLEKKSVFCPVEMSRGVDKDRPVIIVECDKEGMKIYAIEISKFPALPFLAKKFGFKYVDNFHVKEISIELFVEKDHREFLYRHWRAFISYPDFQSWDGGGPLYDEREVKIVETISAKINGKSLLGINKKYGYLDPTDCFPRENLGKGGKLPNGWFCENLEGITILSKMQDENAFIQAFQKDSAIAHIYPAMDWVLNKSVLVKKIGASLAFGKLKAVIEQLDLEELVCIFGKVLIDKEFAIGLGLCKKGVNGFLEENALSSPCKISDLAKFWLDDRVKTVVRKRLFAESELVDFYQSEDGKKKMGRFYAITIWLRDDCPANKLEQFFPIIEGISGIFEDDLADMYVRALLTVEIMEKYPEFEVTDQPF